MALRLHRVVLLCPTLPCSGVVRGGEGWGGEPLRGPACPGANTNRYWFTNLITVLGFAIPAGMYQYLSLQISTSWYKLLPVGTNYYCLAQIITGWYSTRWLFCPMFFSLPDLFAVPSTCTRSLDSLRATTTSRCSAICLSSRTLQALPTISRSTSKGRL